MSQPNKADLRQLVRAGLGGAVEAINLALRGEQLERLEPVLSRLGRGGELPHWYDQLKDDGTLPNLDGKTVGSVVEMLLLAVVEIDLLTDLGLPPLRITPARGVDFPDLDLGVKSPSKNFCTSEPFFSAYERLLGSEYDVVVLLTDYQTKKRTPPLQLQVIGSEYLEKSQVADAGLCEIALANREWLLSENEAWAKKLFRFLAFVNQSDWRAKQVVALMRLIRDEDAVREYLDGIKGDFDRINERRAGKDSALIPQGDLEALVRIGSVSPIQLGVLDCADNWVVDVQKDAGRYPNDNEWNRLLTSPLNGRIGMSFALQWRFNFGKLFPQE